MRNIFKVTCKSCGYTWYPDEEHWKTNPNAPYPDCVNEKCEYYGKGFHPATEKRIWIEGYAKSEDW
jgi:hypothetical protein